jgi:hypothetical protein
MQTGYGEEHEKVIHLYSTHIKHIYFEQNLSIKTNIQILFVQKNNITHM